MEEQNLLSNDSTLNSKHVLQERIDNLPSITQWKQVQTGLLALKEKYDNAVQKIKTLQEERGVLLPENEENI